MIKIAQQMRDRKMQSLLVNTVHDSLIFDAPESEVEELGRIAMSTFKSVPDLMWKYFGWKITVPITGEVEYGPSWGEMKLLEL